MMLGIDTGGTFTDFVLLDQTGYAFTKSCPPPDAPERAKTCVSLAYLKGYSREEIADILSTNTNTVKSWLHRAAEGLNQCIEQSIQPERSSTPAIRRFGIWQWLPWSLT
jgi:N-methylhydantoinase A/oxoprolinase/acetone carboxylase beta subunit